MKLLVLHTSSLAFLLQILWMVVPTFVQCFVILSLKKSVMELDFCLEQHVLNQIFVFRLEHLVTTCNGYQIMQTLKLSTFVKNHIIFKLGVFKLTWFSACFNRLNAKLTFVICFLSFFIYNSIFQFVFLVPIHFCKMSSSENFSPFFANISQWLKALMEGVRKNGKYQ